MRQSVIASGLKFATVYAENVGAVVWFFARQCTEPPVVADLTSQTFVEAIELVDLVGLTPKEAAAVLGVSPGAPRVRFFRARNRLRMERTDEQL